MTALYLPVIESSEQKEETNREKYVFYCIISQIHIILKKHEKTIKMTGLNVPT